MNKISRTGVLLGTIIALLAVTSITFFVMRAKEPGQSLPIRTPEPVGQDFPQAYTNSSIGFSIRYPAGYMIDEKYIYQALGPDRTIPGIKLAIPSSTAKGTNLSADSYISVEPLVGAVNSCSAEVYLGNPTSAGFVDEGGHRYSIARSSDAGAGNRYEETVYATPVANGCLAVRYFIHYSAIENYPADTVREFDKQALLDQFDIIRRTLVITQ